MGRISIDLTWMCKTNNEPLLFPPYHTHLTLYISLDGISRTCFLPWVLLHVIGVGDGCTVLMMSCPSLRVLHLWWNISLDHDVRLLCIRPSMMRRHSAPLMMRCGFWTIRHDLWWDVAPFHGETWHIKHYTPLWRMKSCLFH
jgi:hypothetical protein